MAQTFPGQWSTLSDKIDQERYEHVLFHIHFFPLLFFPLSQQ
jgi:hypothetical protein